jgi:anti-sigma-K factor RskA
MNDRELDELLTEMRMRIGDRQEDLESPPPEVWAGIESHLDDAGPSIDDSPVDEAPPEESTTEHSNVTSLAHHRRRRRPAGLLLAAVAASVAVAVAIGTVFDRGATTIGEVELAVLDTGEAFGSATVVDSDDGIRLEVDLDATLQSDQGEFYELWIIDTEVDQMYSLGRIDSGGTFAVPAGVDVADFPIVDISVERDDGDPTHSGNSVYRGQLTV